MPRSCSRSRSARRSRSLRRSRSRSPKRKEQRKKSPSPADDGEPPAWIQISDLPPKSNWSSMRRLVSQAGGQILGGKVYPNRRPPFALAQVSNKKEAESVAKELDGSRLTDQKIGARVIDEEEKKKLERD
mmetsp:Transcript_40133/g.72683  ORF Transcript_40133/g.72683 Transcript_40133/m.72683 type:complete len:130 (-) Transcript_40133:43-432(-)